MIRYLDSVEGISADQLTGGFFVGWPNPPSPETHLRILQNSYAIVLAVDDETNQIVGFINAISDGILSAYIPLLEVLPAYQKRGVGALLARQIIDKLSKLYMIDLLCDAELQSYYAQFGMLPATGMLIRNYQTQAGLP